MIVQSLKVRIFGENIFEEKQINYTGDGRGEISSS